MLVLYGPLLWISSKFTPVDPLDFTFNSMLQHLLHGQFQVDADIVGKEGFLRGGRVYVYWGIWCALVRLPLWVVGRLDKDFTVWSCLAAVCVAGMAKVRAVVLLLRQCADDPATQAVIGLVLAYILFGGSQLAYLRISVYQEVIFWAYAFAEVFVYFALKGLVIRNFSLVTLNCMAACVGFALLTRVSTGVGLLLAMALLMPLLIMQSAAGRHGDRIPAGPRVTHALTQSRVLMPLGVLLVLIAATGAVNYFRWGDPTVFANFGLAVYRPLEPPQLQGGTFELDRIPFALLYYFLPVWIFHGRDGQVAFAQTHARWFNRVEAPPSSLLLTDLLPLCLIVLLGVHLWKRRARYSPAALQAAALTVGLLSPGCLMLGFTSLAYRYRMEFYPPMDLLAFLGLYLTLARETTPAEHRLQRWLSAALVVSILSSLLALLLYDFSLSIGKPHELYDRAVHNIYKALHLVI